jgi:hypothetical protein
VLSNYSEAIFDFNKIVAPYISGKDTSITKPFIATTLLTKGIAEEAAGVRGRAAEDYKCAYALDSGLSLALEKYTVLHEQLQREYADSRQKDEAAREARRQSNQDLISGLNQLANTISFVQNKNTTSSSYSGGSASNSGSGSSCDSFLQQYEKEKQLALSNIASLTKRKASDKYYGATGAASAQPNPALNGELTKSIHSTQNLMREIRERATKNGCTIPKSDVETWSN